TPAGDLCATGVMREGLVVWAPAANKGPRKLAAGGGLPRGAALSPDGGTVAGNNKGLWLWDVRGGAARGPFGKGKAEGDFIAFAPDGRTIVTSHHGELPHGDGGALVVWDATTGEERLTIPARHTRVWAGAISPDARTMVISTDGHKSALYNL